jgi:hypothetical protein
MSGQSIPIIGQHNGQWYDAMKNLSDLPASAWPHVIGLIIAAVQSERDRCASIAENSFDTWQDYQGIGKQIAAKIKEGAK